MWKIPVFAPTLDPKLFFRLNDPEISDILLTKTDVTISVDWIDVVA